MRDGTVRKLLHALKVVPPLVAAARYLEFPRERVRASARLVLPGSMSSNVFAPVLEEYYVQQKQRSNAYSSVLDE